LLHRKPSPDAERETRAAAIEARKTRVADANGGPG
jgi:hypothetical protein